MPHPCSICSNTHHKEIDKALRAGKTLTEIAGIYGVTSMSLSRHRKKCLERQQTRAAAEAAIAKGASAAAVTPETAPALEQYVDSDSAPDAYSELVNLKRTLSANMKVAITKGSTDLIVAYSREIRSTTETMLKVWETQKRIEAQYEKASPLSATWIYQWLRKHHPAVLTELAKALKEVHQGQAK